MQTRLHRRALLRGMGGVALALPLLEIMGREAAAQEAPLRYLVSYGGCSTGRPDGEFFTPSVTGPGYDITTALMHVGDGSAYGVSGYNIQDYVSVVSGLTVPWQTTGDIPPGGKPENFHGCSVVPQISGTKSLYAGAPPLGPTSDHVVADALAPPTKYKYLAYCVQPSGYISTLGGISFKNDGGTIIPVDPTTSPRAVYLSLFTDQGFQPTDPVEAKKAKELLGRRKSAIDLVRGGLERLLPRLGRADAERMERHLDEVRALEKRLDHVTNVGGECQLLEDPGEDPPIGGTWAYDPVTCSFSNFSPDVGWSNEELRAELLADFIHMAFVCDLCRVVSFQLTDHKCYMNAYHITGYQGSNADVHGLTHSGVGPEMYATVVAWHVKHFVRLAAKLRDTPEGTGNLLNRTAMTLLFEGGLGYDPEVEAGPSPHSTENMIAVVAGKAGGLNQPSQHIAANGAHPAQVLITAMNAVGVESDTLGEVSGTIPGLLA